MFDPAIVVSGPAHVIDGDTLRIGEERVRLFGIDAPELAQMCGTVRCGVQAREWLVRRIAGRPVRCEGESRDQYRRVVAICRIGRHDLARDMVQAGQAVAFRRYSEIYVGDETEARAARRGIWSLRFQLPHEWRRDRR